MADLADVQARLDAIWYPQNHAYNAATLRPYYLTEERLERILSLCPDFFEAETFLDVGASKGFFSLLAARKCSRVFAIEPDRDALEAWVPMIPENVTAVLGTFGQAILGMRGTSFANVFLGNGPHYLYREDPGYMAKLGALTTNRLMMEGPVGAACPDLKDFGPYQEEGEMLTDAYAAGFTLMGRVDSPSYTPGRRIWYFHKTR